MTPSSKVTNYLWNLEPERYEEWREHARKCQQNRVPAYSTAGKGWALEDNLDQGPTSLGIWWLCQGREHSHPRLHLVSVASVSPPRGTVTGRWDTGSSPALPMCQPQQVTANSPLLDTQGWARQSLRFWASINNLGSRKTTTMSFTFQNSRESGGIGWHRLN